jgi:hypothetical protein
MILKIFQNFPFFQDVARKIDKIFLQVIFFFLFQLPYRTGTTSTQARINMEQTLIEQSLIQISRYRFSLVISGLTKMLQRVNEIVRFI